MMATNEVAISLDENHRYWRHGREYAGVTRVLSDMGLYKAPEQAREWHQERGKAVHYGCTLVNRDEWDPEATSPQVKPRIQAYATFKQRYDYVSLVDETIVWSDRHGVAGTLDDIGRICRQNHRAYNKLILIDRKSGQPNPAVVIQLALYRLMAHESLNMHADECWSLWLRDDGTFRFRNCDDDQAERLGIHAVELWHWRRTHRLL